MRGLNKKQKKLLDQYSAEHEDIFSCDELPIELYEKLERINDHETIYQNINRYLDDLRFKKMYSK